jgi:hypothetical protein
LSTISSDLSTQMIQVWSLFINIFMVTTIFCL